MSQRPDLPIIDEEYEDFIPSPSSRLAANYLVLIGIALACSMCMSNICAVKIWQVGPLILDGGLLLFPFTYVLEDVLVELFYQRYAGRVVLWCCLFNLACFLILTLTAQLPASPTADQVDAISALNLSGRVFIASIIAKLASNLINNYVYDAIRDRFVGSPKQRNSRLQIAYRSWLSSVIAHLPDSALFTFLAFAGRQANLAALIQQFLASYFAGVIVELPMILITVTLSTHLRRNLQFVQHLERQAASRQ